MLTSLIWWKSPGRNSGPGPLNLRNWPAVDAKDIGRHHILVWNGLLPSSLLFWERAECQLMYRQLNLREHTGYRVSWRFQRCVQPNRTVPPNRDIVLTAPLNLFPRQ